MRKEEIFALLSEKGVSSQEVEQMILEKREQIGPHITEEGIIAIIAAHYGITSQHEESELTISGIVDGLSSINIVAKVLRIFEEKEFHREDGPSGKLQTLLLADKTGKIYLTLWDREVEAHKGKVHNGNVVRLINASSGKGPSGPQLRLGYKGRLIVEDEGKFPDLTLTQERRTSRKGLGELKAGDRYIESRATVSNIYRLTIYDACPTCQKRATKTKDGHYCENCRTRVTPHKTMVMEIGIDDGSAHMHATLFGDSASEFLSEDAETVARTFQEYIDAGYQPKTVGLEYVIEKKPFLLGKEIVVSGSVAENDFTGTIFNVYDIKPLDAEKETERILKELEGRFDE